MADTWWKRLLNVLVLLAKAAGWLLTAVGVIFFFVLLYEEGADAFPNVLGFLIIFPLAGWVLYRLSLVLRNIVTYIVQGKQ